MDFDSDRSKINMFETDENTDYLDFDDDNGNFREAVKKTKTRYRDNNMYGGQSMPSYSNMTTYNNMNGMNGNTTAYNNMTGRNNMMTGLNTETTSFNNMTNGLNTDTSFGNNMNALNSNTASYTNAISGLNSYNTAASNLTGLNNGVSATNDVMYGAARNRVADNNFEVSKWNNQTTQTDRLGQTDGWNTRVTNTTVQNYNSVTPGMNPDMSYLDYTRLSNRNTSNSNSIANRNIETDIGLYGGADDDRDEQDLYDIFSRAQKYGNRIGSTGVNATNSRSAYIQNGGARELNPELRVIIEVAKVMYKSKKYPEIKWTDTIKVSKLVVNRAKQQTKSDDLEVVKERAMELIENPDEFIKIYNSQKVMPQEVPGLRNKYINRMRRRRQLM
jgi:hypothetical protein